MTAAQKDWIIEKGATFEIPLLLQGPPPGCQGLDLTGYIGRMQARLHISDPDPPVLDCSGGQFTFDSTGHMLLTVDDSITDALDWDKAVYDLEIESPAGKVTRLLQGVLRTSPNVTR